MSVARRDFEIPSGSAVEFVVDVVGGPASLTGFAGSMMIRELRTDVDPVATVDPADITVDAGSRQVTVKIPAASTASWTFRRGVYDLLITGAGGEAWRLVEGRVIRSQAVTR